MPEVAPPPPDRYVPDNCPVEDPTPDDAPAPDVPSPDEEPESRVTD
jgi:hypothetical protein